MLVPKSLFVTDPVTRLLHQAGVPRSLWNWRLKSTRFLATTVWGAKFTPDQQRQAVIDYVEAAKSAQENKRNPQRSFYAIVSSDPTGDGAQAMCAAIIRELLQTLLAARAKNGQVRKTVSQDRMSFLYLDASSWTRPRIHQDKDPDVVVIWNVYEDSPPERLDTIRQMLTTYYGSVRLLAVAGAKNPEKWSLERLRLRPHIAFKVRDVDQNDMQ